MTGTVFLIYCCLTSARTAADSKFRKTLNRPLSQRISSRNVCLWGLFHSVESVLDEMRSNVWTMSKSL